MLCAHPKYLWINEYLPMVHKLGNTTNYKFTIQPNSVGKSLLSLCRQFNMVMGQFRFSSSMTIKLKWN